MGLSRDTFYYDHAPGMDIVLQSILTVTKLNLFVDRDNNALTLSMSESNEESDTIRVCWVYERSDLVIINELEESRRVQFCPDKQHVISVETQTQGLEYLLKTIIWILRDEYKGINSYTLDGYTVPKWIGKSYDDYLESKPTFRLKRWLRNRFSRSN